MFVASKTNPRTRPQQTGAALLVGLMVLLVGLGVFLSSGLSATKYQRDAELYDWRVLHTAKQAVIRDALAYTGQSSGSTVPKPGRFRCPDVSPYDGQSDFGGCPDTLGRLPWKTLDIERLRDSAGQDLWYAVSAEFRATNGVFNSDTLAELKLDDQEQVIAIIIAPGMPVDATQNLRHQNPLDPDQYLESLNAVGGLEYVSQAANGELFNDRVIAITVADVIPHIERRAMRVFARALNQFFVDEGKYPFMADYTNQPIEPDDYFQDKGANTTFGRLPINPSNPTNPGSFDLLTLDETWVVDMQWHRLILAKVAYPHTQGHNPACGGVCMTLLGGALPNDQHPLLLIAPGWPLPGQDRSNGDLAAYLEDENRNGDLLFQQADSSLDVNDNVFPVTPP